MISRTGNRISSIFLSQIFGRLRNSVGQNLQNNKGLSFFEIMVTVAILSFGLIMIYKSFFLSLDYSNHLTFRLNANMLLDEKISYIEQLFKEYQQLPLGETQEIKRVVLNNKPVDFIYEINFSGVDGLTNIFQLDISLSWFEGPRKINLTRSVYIYNYKQTA